MFMASSGGGAHCKIDLPILTELLLFSQSVTLVFLMLSFVALGTPILLYLLVWFYSYKVVRKEFLIYVVLPISIPIIGFLLWVPFNVNWDYVSYKMNSNTENQSLDTKIILPSPQRAVR